MTVYPDVMSEMETLNLVLRGKSLARYGDGEFNLCTPTGRAKKQVHDERLSFRLRTILHDEEACLIGIPNLRSPTPKAEFWSKYADFGWAFGNREYCSAFVTRPDSAPWIDRPDYWAKVERLWLGKRVTLVRGSDLSWTKADLVGAEKVHEIIWAGRNAWAGYGRLLEQIGTPECAILCLGPTATVLAVDLCAKGVHAIDAGHLGMFWKKHRKGEPMVVTKADKAA